MAGLTKIEVGPGIVWVEAPALGWSILCGCPGDVVKNLKRLDLIREIEKHGVRTETGPNAILLSDVMLQNGSFANLAEFPVLQMLYRQGMIVPNHPNNIGQKPLLIGNERQVEAQLHYIHRGNYGLVSDEELTKAGVGPDLIHEIQAFKRHFAFGHIRHPSELLDCEILGEAPVTLKGGLVISRLAINIFELRLGDDRIEVDLTLAPGQSYQPPFKLAAHRAPREYFSVIHGGDSNGWDPERPSMGSILSFQGRIYLVDAGPHIQATLDALGIGVNEIVGLFHTHCHDDHFAGLTTLLRTDHRLKYFATPLVRASVTKKLSALMAIPETMFTDCFEVHDLTFDVWNNISGLDVMPILSPHPVETNLFLFRALSQGGYRSYAHWADVVSSTVLQRMIETPTAPGISQAFYDRVMADYQRPANLKKIDVGGGLIHGMADDFKSDPSTHIRLSHLDRPLSEAELAIGTESSFGSSDVLIAGNQDYDWRDASEFLFDYFPFAPQSELASLLTCPIRTHRPGQDLLRQGDSISLLHLIVSGTVDRVCLNGVVGGGFTAGSLIGEVNGLTGRSAAYSYRCRSYVRSMLIPIEMMHSFLERNQLQEELLARAEARSFLRSTEICAEPLAETTLTRLAQSLIRRHVAAGQEIDVGEYLALLAQGSIILSDGGNAQDHLKPGAVFNEERAMFSHRSRLRARAETDGEIALLPADLIRQIPLLRWTLLERLGHRMAAGLVPIERRRVKRSAGR